MEDTPKTDDDKKKWSFHSSAFESQKGRRWSMEDTHVAFDNLLEQYPTLSSSSGNMFSLYAVFDGHGGVEAANLCEELVPKNLVNLIDPSLSNVEEAITKCFLQTDEEILNRSKYGGWKAGSTGVLTLVINRDVYVGNVGDSEAVLANKLPDGTYEAQLLSEKHKPSNATEKARIEKAGGHVIFGRVLGQLAVARAFGDIEYKKEKNSCEFDYVTVEPFVKKYPLAPNAEFLIVACDGLWDKFTYQEAVDFVAKTRASGKSIQETTTLLVQESLDKGSLDNVTAVLVFFGQSQ